MCSRKLETIRSPRSAFWGPMSGVSAIAIAALVAPAQAASLTDWSFDPRTNHLEVTVEDGTQPRYFVMAQPARIVLDLPGTSIAGAKTQASYDGAVRQVRVSQFQPNVTRIVLELAPNTRLAAGQVNLQRLGGTSNDSHWVLSPLLADSTAMTTTATTSRSTSQAASDSTSVAASPAAIVPPAQPSAATAATPVAATSPLANPAPPPINTESPQSAQPIVPPALPSAPGAAAIVPAPIAVAPPAAIVPPALPAASAASPPVPVAALPPAAVEATAPPTNSTSAPLSRDRPNPPVPIAPIAAPPSSVPSPSPTIGFPTAAAPASLEIPSTLPIAPATPTITVPAPSAAGIASPASPGSSVDLVPTQAQSLQPVAPPSATLPEVLTAPVTVPPLQSPASSGPAAAPQTAAVGVPPLPSASAAPRPISAPPPASSTIEFGQPLPEGESLRSNGLLAGTLLSLRYPGSASLKLRSGTPQQEVLLLHSEVRDEAGNIIAPKDSMVIGRFETDRAGSRFIAQAISLQGRSVPLVAQSELLTGGLKVSDRNLAVNSGVGAIAGGLIGGFSGAGVAGGAAVGAAATLLTSPKPATVQPGQIVQIRLLQDLR